MSIEINAAEDPRSDAQVDVSTPDTTAHWCAALGITDEALMRAVQVVGPRVDRIKDFLGAGGMAGQQEDA